jgi:hypothetical protein
VYARKHGKGCRLLTPLLTNRCRECDDFETPFNLRYHTSVPLDGNVSSVYSGWLTHVISRLLSGYDYVIAHDQGQSISSFGAGAAKRLRRSKSR